MVSFIPTFYLRLVADDFEKNPSAVRNNFSAKDIKKLFNSILLFLVPMFFI